MQQRSDDAEAMPVVTPLPKVPIILTILAMCATSASIMSYASIIAFEIKYYAITQVESEYGWYAGWILSVGALTKCLSVSVWGLLSDRYGRKFVICTGLLVNTICYLCLSFTYNYYVAVLIKATQGVFESIVTVVRSYVHDFADPSNEALAYSITNVSGSISSRLSSAISGVICFPAQKVSFLAHVYLFVQFPFVLVCWLTALINLIAFVACLLFMDRYSNKKLQKEQEDEGSSTEPLIEKQAAPSYLSAAYTLFGQATFVKLFLYTICFNIVIEMFRIAVPVWLAQSTPLKGLHWNTSAIGVVLGSGVIGSFFVLAVPNITKSMGMVTTMQVTSFMLAFFSAIMPFAFEMSQYVNVGIVALYVAIIWIIRTSMFNISIVAQAILLNHAISEELNGVAHGTIGIAYNLALVIAPLLCGGIMSASLKLQTMLEQKHIWIPLLEKTTFFVISSVGFIGFVIASLIPKSAESKSKHF